jgi:hypothetical protein
MNENVDILPYVVSGIIKRWLGAGIIKAMIAEIS